MLTIAIAVFLFAGLICTVAILSALAANKRAYEGSSAFAERPIQTDDVLPNNESSTAHTAPM